MKTILVRAQWDPEAEVWVATSDDVPGLVTEAETHRALVAKLHVMIPELLEEDDADTLADGDMPEIPVVIISEQFEKIRVRRPKAA